MAWQRQVLRKILWFSAFKLLVVSERPWEDEDVRSDGLFGEQHEKADHTLGHTSISRHGNALLESAATSSDVTRAEASRMTANERIASLEHQVGKFKDENAKLQAEVELLRKENAELRRNAARSEVDDFAKGVETYKNGSMLQAYTSSVTLGVALGWFVSAETFCAGGPALNGLYTYITNMIHAIIACRSSSPYDCFVNVVEVSNCGTIASLAVKGGTHLIHKLQGKESAAELASDAQAQRDGEMLQQALDQFATAAFAFSRKGQVVEGIPKLRDMMAEADAKAKLEAQQKALEARYQGADLDFWKAWLTES